MQPQPNQLLQGKITRMIHPTPSDSTHAIVFDLDGTLIDSENLALVAWRNAVARFGKQFTETHHGHLVGITLDEALRLVVDWFDLPVTPEQFMRVVAETWSAETIHGLPAMPGLEVLRTQLERQQLRWGVATNSERQYAIDALRGIGLLDACQALVGSDEVAQGKPAPDLFLTCAARLGVEPRHCLAVEDSVLGHRAAAAAGMRVVVIPNRWSEDAQFTEADYFFPSLAAFSAELPTLLNGSVI
jgi:HAD superfamily hydrolase (TIGR01509 family)